MKQESRQAIIELLLLSLYIDGNLTLAEDTALASALDGLGWESSSPKEVCILNAFAKARGASSCQAKTDEFLTERALLLKADGQTANTMAWLGKVLAADGLSPDEERFLEKLHRLLTA